MKVVFISKNIPLPNYNENNIIIEQAKALKANGVDVEAFYPKELAPKLLGHFSKRLKANSQLKSNFEINGLKVQTVSYIRLFFFPLFEWVLSFFGFSYKKPKDIDLIHAHFVFPDLLIANSMKNKSTKVFVTVRQGDFINASKSPITHLLMRRYLLKADVIIALTPLLGEKVRILIEDDGNKIKLVPSFIADEFYTSMPEKINSKTFSNKLKVICVANLIKRKNVSWLVSAHNKSNLSFDLTIIGDGPELDNLKELADASVEFRGKLNRSDIIAELDSSDLFVLPSDDETFGLVYIEAMSRGKPVIAKKNTGLYGFNSLALDFIDSELELYNIILKYSKLNNEDMKLRIFEALEFSKKFQKQVVIDNLISEYRSSQ